MTAPAALARASGAPIVPMRCVADDGGRYGGHYRLSFEAPLEAGPGLSRAEATRELTLRLNALFEGWIRLAPEQWAWHQPRWRTRPGEHVPLPLAARRARRRAPAGASLRGLQDGLDGP
jgi:lauroyl/myristoyl acyltransferase